MRSCIVPTWFKDKWMRCWYLCDDSTPGMLHRARWSDTTEQVRHDDNGYGDEAAQHHTDWHMTGCDTLRLCREEIGMLQRTPSTLLRR